MFLTHVQINRFAMQISAKTSQEEVHGVFFVQYRQRFICGKQNTMRCKDGVLSSGAVFIVLVCLDHELLPTIHVAPEITYTYNVCLRPNQNQINRNII